MSASNPPNPDPTEIAGRYQIVKKLGAGAFGTVYKAKDKVLGRMLAIKTIRLEGLAASQAGLKEMLDRFNREAQTAAQLRHPNIVTIYDFGESQGLTYLAMEFIDGVGLDSVITASGRLPVPRAAALAAQVADALDYANQHHVVHRDIKPPNIMVESDDRVKVTDFGIAKPGESAEHLTMTGSLLGTPAYMSPEQARGEKLDGRSDLFSLGCVLYEMVAGHKAFRGDSITALLFKILTEEPKPLQEVDPELPEEMVRIVNKAIAKKSESRYQSGREMAQDLLTLARPGNVPTLRTVDSPTLQPPAAATEIRTIHSSPTVMADAPGNVTARAGGATSAVRKPSGPPPLPTIVAPGPAAAPAARAEGTLRPDSTGRVAATHRDAAPPPPKPAAAAPAPARRGGGLGLLLGIAAVLFVVFAGVVIGAWMLYRHRQAALEAAAQPTPAPTAVAEMATPTPAPFSTPVAEATPGPMPTSAAATPAPDAATPLPTPRAEAG
ncbi:MAG TPA: serine/threonine-protein kinase, partial [Vicinamibacteria bacterium]|nr:serine/threonine-protein kinase [Vicinamibacteria bacterium]